MIQYTLDSLFQHTLEDKVLEYSQKLGRPDRIMYDKRIRDGHYTAILTYDDDHSNVKVMYNTAQILQEQLVETNANFKKLIASMEKLNNTLNKHYKLNKLV